MDRRETFDRIALSCITYLESFSECKNVNFQCGEGAASHESIMWDKKNAPFKMPKDLKSFCSLFNGVFLSWSVDLGGRNVVIGEIRVNRMEAIKPFEIEGTYDSKAWNDMTSTVPDSKLCTAFILDSHCEVGEVLLLYKGTAASVNANANSSSADSEESVDSSAHLEEPEIWFVDQSSRWHYICKTFTQYLRLLVIHLGIHGWQLAFTPEGLPTTTQQWMTMFCKERLLIDRYWRERLLPSSKS